MPAEPVLAADTWRTNGELIADVAALYLDETMHMIDPTYGRGNWWTKWRPTSLVCHDFHTLDGVDFCDLPEDNDTYDAGAYDPPYVCVGGRQTTGLAGMHDAYGLTRAPKTPAGLQHLINDGLAEMRRVVKPRGLVLVKCQDYVTSGKLWPGTHHTLAMALSLGMTLVDRFEHVGAVRPQPPGRRQVHARRNLSTLFVLEVPQ